MLVSFATTNMCNPTIFIVNPLLELERTTMSVTVLAEVKIRLGATDELAEYFRVTGPLLEAAGARIVSRLNINEILIGKNAAKTMFIVEYPSRDAVFQVFASETYEDIIPIRDAAFELYNISICDSSVTEALPQNDGADQLLGVTNRL
jgi:uncharacterized protein (DUF1330 family)